VTADTNIPRPVEPGTGSDLGPSLINRPPASGTPLITGERGITQRETELRGLEQEVRRAAKKGLDTAAYRKAKAKYDAKLAELNRERGKIGLGPVTSVEQLETEKTYSASTLNVDEIKKNIDLETRLGNTNKAKELESKLAEAQAVRSANLATPSGVKPVSQQGMAGYIPDIATARPILDEKDFTITVVDANNNPIVVGNKPLQSVFLIFEDKNFYERGVKTTVRNATYKNAEEIRQLAFSLNKSDRKKMQEEFKKLNLLPKNYNANGELDRDGAFEQAFLNAHTFANRVNYNNLVNNQPILGLSDAIKQYKSEESGGPTVSRTISEFSLSDGQAEGLLEEFYTRALGVRPTQQDINQFKEIVQRRAGKKPRVTETTTAADGSTVTTRVADTGFGAAEAEILARRQAEARPEFAPYQMATTFYDAILRAAQSPVRLQDTGL
jgi:hypothetical protein